MDCINKHWSLVRLLGLAFAFAVFETGSGTASSILNSDDTSMQILLISDRLINSSIQGTFGLAAVLSSLTCIWIIVLYVS
jgi:hypothetical protein